MGVLQVNNLDEMADLLLAFLYLPVPRGRNVGVVGIGGGISVQAADDCEAVGLHVYPLPPEIRAELKKITPEAGTSIANPIDSTLMFSPEEFYKTITITASCQQIDLLIVHMTLEFGIGYLGGIQMMQAVADNVIRAGKKTAKPMAVVLRTAGSLPIWQGFLELRERFQKAGFPVFPTVASAALALGRFLQYHQSRDRNE